MRPLWYAVKAERTPRCEGGARQRCLSQHRWDTLVDLRWSIFREKGRGGVRSLFFFFFARQVSRGDGNLSERKTGRKRNVWKLGAAHEQQPKMHKLLEGGGISGWGRGGRDEGRAGSGPVMVGGAAEGLTAGCCVVEEETACCSGQRDGGWWWLWGGGSSSREGPSASSTSRGERRAREFASPPQSLRTLRFLTACLLVSSAASSQSFSCKERLEKKIRQVIWERDERAKRTASRYFLQNRIADESDTSSLICERDWWGKNMIVPE